MYPFDELILNTMDSFIRLIHYWPSDSLRKTEPASWNSLLHVLLAHLLASDHLDPIIIVIHILIFYLIEINLSSFQFDIPFLLLDFIFLFYSSFLLLDFTFPIWFWYFNFLKIYLPSLRFLFLFIFFFRFS